MQFLKSVLNFLLQCLRFVSFEKAPVLPELLFICLLTELNVS